MKDHWDKIYYLEKYVHMVIGIYMINNQDI